MEALLISVDEPQLERCLESIRTQTVSFSNVVHINNPNVPQAEAHNYGMSLLRDEWFMLIAGDMILDSFAVEMAIGVIDKNVEVVGHLFSLYDNFMRCVPRQGIGIFRTDVLKLYPYLNRLDADRWMGKKLDRNGLVMKPHREITLATHFDSPDEFQVFKKFYVSGMKYRGDVVSMMISDLENLFRETSDPLYELAIKAVDFGRNRRDYPGSKNVAFEKKMYEEFNALQKT